MGRLLIGQLFIFWSFQSYAGEIRTTISEVINTFSSSSCVVAAQKIEKSFMELKASDYQSQLGSQEHSEISQELWDLKLKLHKGLRTFHEFGDYSPECANALRGAFRAIRLVEDFVEEDFARKHPDLEIPNSAFEIGNPFVHKAREFQKFELSKDLRSGDILLTRGNAFTSAAIASLGEFDTQFSHMSIVHVDEQGKIWTVEAHIEVGSFVRPLEDHIKDRNFRTMVIRFDDRMLAAAAASFAFENVKKASETKGNINYDFGFDMDEDHNLFCSEVISWAFDKVSAGEVKIPFIRNKIQKRKPTFVRDLGITAKESFIPADIEIDPRFKIIAEWRDAKRINDSHEKDAILQAMYSWVDSHNYRMINGSSSKSKFYKNIVWVMRRTPILKIFVKEKLPLNMSRTLIGYFGVLESIGEMLQTRLAIANTDAITIRGVPLLPNEKFKILESYRVKDLKENKGQLHKMFRPLAVK
jgi:hypothetical protein